MCKHTFTAISGTPLARLRHKDQWLNYSAALIAGRTVRASARQCGINKNTSFRWRHRFLTLPAAAKANHLEGVVEADETFFPVSCKGQRQLDRPPRKRGKQIHMRGTGKDQVPVLIVRDRSGATADFILDAIDKKAIEPPLRTVLKKNVIFCSDGAAVYRSMARSLGIIHRPVNLAAGVRVIAGVYHIQNVNAYHGRLKQWVKTIPWRCNPVSEKLPGMVQVAGSTEKSQFTCCRTASCSRPEKSVSTVNEYIAKNKY